MSEKPSLKIKKKQIKFAKMYSKHGPPTDIIGLHNKSGKKRSYSETSDSDSDKDDIQECDDVVILGSMKSKDFSKTKKIHKKKIKSAKQLIELSQEKINIFRKKKKIHVYGSDVAMPVASFDQLEEKYCLSPILRQNIAEHGYEEPTPIQMQAITVMMDRREILACAPTGSGKTAAFLIPILQYLHKSPKKVGFRAIILAPTRELVTQTHTECSRLSKGLGLGVHKIDKAYSAAKNFDTVSSLDILVTTPNRLVYMLKADPPTVNMDSIEWLVIDESDKLFEEGQHGFRNQLAKIYRACDSKNVRRALFSATFAYEVEEWCKLNLDNLISVYIGARNSATDTIKQELTFVGSEAGKRLEIRNIFRKEFQPPALIFVQSKERSKELYHELKYDGVNVDVIHADKTQHERDNVVESFLKGVTWVLIATDLMARGIDFKGVNLVINYDFPITAVSYIHRIGRTGRAGRKGKAVTLFTQDDWIYLRSIARVMKESGCRIPEYMLNLKKPSKKLKRKLKYSAPERESISTDPTFKIKQGKKNKFSKVALKKKKNRETFNNQKNSKLDIATPSKLIVAKDHIRQSKQIKKSQKKKKVKLEK